MDKTLKEITISLLSKRMIIYKINKMWYTSYSLDMNKRKRGNDECPYIQTILASVESLKNPKNHPLSQLTSESATEPLSSSEPLSVVSALPAKLAWSDGRKVTSSQQLRHHGSRLVEEPKSFTFAGGHFLHNLEKTGQFSDFLPTGK